MLVEIEMSRSREEEICLEHNNGMKVFCKVEYENHPLVCDYCLNMGHVQANCSKLKHNEHKSNKNMQVKIVPPHQKVLQPKAHQAWHQVKKKQVANNTSIPMERSLFRLTSSLKPKRKEMLIPLFKREV